MIRGSSLSSERGEELVIFGMVAEANWEEDFAIDVIQRKNKTRRKCIHCGLLSQQKASDMII